MTFALKDFDNLKKEFSTSLDRLRENKEVKNFNELSNPDRKYQIQFLQTVLAELEKQISDEKIKLPKSQAATIFYGAMLLINEDINSTGSYTQQLFTKAMGITKTSKLSATQLAECYAALNEFMKLIFIKHDSSNGLAKEHALQSITFEQLIKLVKKSYKLEEISLNEATSNIKFTTKTLGDISQYKITNAVPKSALESFKSWDELKEALDKLINIELGSKTKTEIDLLDNKERVAQYKFLIDIAECLSLPETEIEVESEKNKTHSKNSNVKNIEKKLNPLKPEEKMAIFAGAGFLVLEEISKSYGKNPLDFSEIKPSFISKLISSGSKTHLALTKILHAKDARPEDIESLIQATNSFIQFMSIDMEKIKTIEKTPEKNQEKNKTKEKVEQKFPLSKKLFSDIEGFNPAITFASINEMTYSCRIKAFDNCIKQVKDELELAKKTKEKEKLLLKPQQDVKISWFSQPFFTTHNALQKPLIKEESKNEQVNKEEKTEEIKFTN